MLYLITVKWYHFYLTVLCYSIKVQDDLIALLRGLAYKRKYSGNTHHHSLANDDAIAASGLRRCRVKRPLFGDDRMTLKKQPDTFRHKLILVEPNVLLSSLINSSGPSDAVCPPGCFHLSLKQVSRHWQFICSTAANNLKTHISQTPPCCPSLSLPLLLSLCNPFCIKMFAWTWVVYGRWHLFTTNDVNIA